MWRADYNGYDDRQHDWADYCYNGVNDDGHGVYNNLVDDELDADDFHEVNDDDD
jgi:hypothetical protein